MRRNVFLTDFGLAKNVATGSKYTRSGVTLGTPSYMSPEQARGAAGGLSPASDVWALGCVLHELLTGRKTFDGETPAAVIGAVLTVTPAPLPGAPRRVRRLVGACLSRPASHRPAAASAMCEECDRVLAGHAPRARAPRPRRTRAVAALVAATALGGAAVWSWWRSARAPAASARSDDDRAAAALALRRTDPVAGAQQLARLVAKRPGRHDWRLALGDLHFTAGHTDRAVGEWNTIPREAAEWPAAQLRCGLATMYALRAWAGRARFEAAAVAPGRVGAVARAAVAYYDDRWTDVARILDQNPCWETTLLRAIVTPDRPGASIEAGRDAYEAVLAEGLRVAWIHLNLAHRYHDLGRLEAAREACDRALALRPGYVKALLKRGTVLTDLGRLREAVDDFDAVLARRPGDLQTRFNRALAVRDLGRPAEAIAGLTVLLQEQSDYYPALAARAELYRLAGDRPHALEDLNRALALRTDDADAWEMRGHLRLAERDFPGAAADFERALALQPRNWSARFGRSVLRIRRREFRAALADTLVVLEERPDHRPALANRAALLRDLGDTAGALRASDAMLAAYPADLKARANRAMLRVETGDLAGAAADLEEALRRAPADWSFRADAERLLASVRRDLSTRGR